MLSMKRTLIWVQIRPAAMLARVISNWVLLTRILVSATFGDTQQLHAAAIVACITSAGNKGVLPTTILASTISAGTYEYSHQPSLCQQYLPMHSGYTQPPSWRPPPPQTSTRHEDDRLQEMSKRHQYDTERLQQRQALEYQTLKIYLKMNLMKATPNMICDLRLLHSFYDPFG